MNTRDFILLVFAIILGVLIAGGIIAKIAATQLQSSVGGSSILSIVGRLFTTSTPANAPPVVQA